MQIRFEADGVTSAAARLSGAAGDLRRLVGAATGLTAGVLDPALGAALAALADICADTLEVVALDLDLLAGAVRAGAVRYDGVETAVVRTTGTVTR